MNIFITGATGFLGKRLINKMKINHDFSITGCVRKKTNISTYSSFEIPNIDGNTDWSTALKNQRVVIHTAGRAHIMTRETAKSFAEYNKVNVDGTLNLAEQAAILGVKRFIFISSIKVNGEKTNLDLPFTEQDKPKPKDIYGISKWEAEKGLQEISKKTNMEIVIIRPPLIYGSEVKGNFKKIINLVKTGIPLPLGKINNKRSFVAVDNLVDIITVCLEHPAASNEVFLVSDGEDISTTELLKKIAKTLDKKSMLITLPIFCLKIPALILGKREMVDRLIGSLQIDISKSQDLLNWNPPISMDEGLRLCFIKE